MLAYLKDDLVSVDDEFEDFSGLEHIKSTPIKHHIYGDITREIN